MRIYRSVTDYTTNDLIYSIEDYAKQKVFSNGKVWMLLFKEFGNKHATIFHKLGQIRKARLENEFIAFTRSCLGYLKKAPEGYRSKPKKPKRMRSKKQKFKDRYK